MPPWISPIAPIQPVSGTPMARPYKLIPSPRSSQCRAPPWWAPTNHFHRPIQSRAPMARPHKSIPSPRSSQCHAPHDTPPTNQFHRPDPVARPHDASPYINPITHHPKSASVVRSMAHPHKSIPSPDSASFKFPFKCLKPTNITNWSYTLYNILRHPNTE